MSDRVKRTDETSRAEAGLERQRRLKGIEMASMMLDRTQLLIRRHGEQTLKSVKKTESRNRDTMEAKPGEKREPPFESVVV